RLVSRAALRSLRTQRQRRHDPVDRLRLGASAPPDRGVASPHRGRDFRLRLAPRLEGRWRRVGLVQGGRGAPRSSFLNILDVLERRASVGSVAQAPRGKGAAMTAFAPAIVRPKGARSRIAFDVISVVAGSLIVAGLAQVSIRLHFTPVPITGQTLGVLLVGASLGALRGGAALGLYLVEGGIGLPFFAGGTHGWSILTVSKLGASGGYLFGFVAAALVVGYLAERGWDRSVRSSI